MEKIKIFNALDNEVHWTSDYSIFKKMEGNRDAKTKSKIIESIKTVGYIPIPIAVNENMEVGDGQNRVDALEELNLPVAYVIIPCLRIKEARALNLNQANWKCLDYIKSYAEGGNENYRRFLELIKSFPKYSHQELFGIAKRCIVSSGWVAS